MSLTPELYVEFFVSVARGMYDRQLDIGAAAELCYTAAQPNAEAMVVDILDELKAELTDWIPSDLNSIHECNIIQIVFDSFDNPGDGNKRNVAQVVRLAVAPGWHWSHVHASRTNIDDAITEVGRRHLPDYAEDVQMVRRTKALGDQPIARGGFNPRFRDNIEAEVDKFREELDRLFPTQEGG